MAEIGDERFEQFCSDADMKTPARAAAELRRTAYPTRSSRARRTLRAARRGRQGGPVAELHAERRPDDLVHRPAPERSLLAQARRRCSKSVRTSMTTRLRSSTTRRTRVVSLLEHPATDDVHDKGARARARPVRKDDELHRRRREGGRPRLSAGHRPRRHPQRAPPADAEPARSRSWSSRTRSSGIS